VEGEWRNAVSSDDLKYEILPFPDKKNSSAMPRIMEMAKI
jgi:hypothetical protein